MILTEQQIKDIIKLNPNRELIAAARAASKALRLHIDGEGLASAVVQIEGFEDLSLKTLRARYAKSNKDLMKRLSQPLENIFSAKGGTVYYNLTGEREQLARRLAMQIRSGMSIRGWIRNYWLPNYLRDPNGIIFIETVVADQAMTIRTQGKSVAYPTYKSSAVIYDYKPDGNRLEWIVFSTTQSEKKALGLDENQIVFRLVDDAFDYYISFTDGEAIILNSFTIPNPYGQVPAILNSDLPNPSKPGIVLSLFDDVLELANEFFLKGSIRVTHEFMHAYPKYWEYADDCQTCSSNGMPATGFKDGKPCPDCKGTGKRLMSKVSDVKLLNHPDRDTPAIAPHVAGYVSPDKVYFEIASAGMAVLEDLMHFTIWGSASRVKTQGTSGGTGQGGEPKTATEVMDEMKPVAERLFQISEMAEQRHAFVLNMAIIANIDPSYQGSSVSYGKRYIMEAPDAIWNKYSLARTAGAAASVLDDLLLEYYESKYSTDPVKLAIQQKLMRIEPFVHYTVLQVKGLDCTDLDYYRKLYYSEWLSSLNEAMILSISDEGLLALLMDYALTKMADKPKPVAVAGF